MNLNFQYNHIVTQDQNARVAQITNNHTNHLLIDISNEEMVVQNNPINQLENVNQLENFGTANNPIDLIDLTEEKEQPNIHTDLTNDVYAIAPALKNNTAFKVIENDPNNGTILSGKNIVVDGRSRGKAKFYKPFETDINMTKGESKKRKGTPKENKLAKKPKKEISLDALSSDFKSIMEKYINEAPELNELIEISKNLAKIKDDFIKRTCKLKMDTKIADFIINHVNIYVTSQKDCNKEDTLLMKAEAFFDKNKDIENRSKTQNYYAIVSYSFVSNKSCLASKEISSLLENANENLEVYNQIFKILKKEIKRFTKALKVCTDYKLYKEQCQLGLAASYETIADHYFDYANLIVGEAKLTHYKLAYKNYESALNLLNMLDQDDAETKQKIKAIRETIDLIETEISEMVAPAGLIHGEGVEKRDEDLPTPGFSLAEQGSSIDSFIENLIFKI